MQTSLIQQVIVTNDLIRRAYNFAKHIHHGQTRQNGEPFFNHCLATAETLANWYLDEVTITAGFLHDVIVKNGAGAIPEIKKEFGEEIAGIATGFANISEVKYRGTEGNIDTLRKFILYLGQNVGVLLIKFACRLNTLQSLYAYPEAEQKHIARKTIEVYAPLARQLGMYEVAGELEDLAFPYLYPEDYEWIISNAGGQFEERKEYLKKFAPLLKDELESNGIKIIDLHYRAKHHFSLHEKLLRYDMNLEKIYDLVAVRVIVKDVSDCYAALGVIHRVWPPVPGRIKDYIASPKPNGYQSLHTTINALDGRTVEIQIRTEEMHQEAEIGIAARFAYQNIKGTKSYLRRLTVAAHPEEINLVKELRKFPRNIAEIDFFRDKLFVLTPRGEVFDLPVGATPVDFAYRIHNDIGDTCVGAKINGSFVALDSELKSGDIVEILTQKNKKPSESWLVFIKTSQAREKIRSALRDRQAAALPGKAGIDKIEFTLGIKDRPGLINDIKEVFSKSRIKIKTITVDRVKNRKPPAVKIICPSPSKGQLKMLSSRLKDLKGINKLTCKYIR